MERGVNVMPMPWETGFLAIVLGGQSVAQLPEVPDWATNVPPTPPEVAMSPATPKMNLTGREEAGGCSKRPRLITAGFERFTPAGKVREQCLAEWRQLVMENPEATLVGKQLREAEDEKEAALTMALVFEHGEARSWLGS